MQALLVSVTGATTNAPADDYPDAVGDARHCFLRCEVRLTKARGHAGLELV